MKLIDEALQKIDTLPTEATLSFSFLRPFSIGVNTYRKKLTLFLEGILIQGSKQEVTKVVLRE